METILILGGFGFLGTNLIHYASRNLSGRYQFIVFDIYDIHPLELKFGNILRIYKGDFSNEDNMREIFEAHRIDYVFHFVSTTIPANSNNNIVYDIESNLVATIKLLDLCRSKTIRRVFYISSGGAVYGTSDNFVHRENDVLSPNSSYGIVKLATEKYLKLYSHLYALDYLALRLSNPYGPFHLSRKQGLVNIALRKAIQGEEFEVWGDGTNIKDYIYTEDVAKIIFQLMDRGITNQILNVGSGEGSTTNEILELVRELIPSFRIIYRESKSFDVAKVVLNTECLSQLIDYEVTNLKIGIQRTYKWTWDQLKRHGQ